MSYFPFRLTAYDKWSNLKINKVNAPQLWQYISGWGGVYIYNGDDESIGGGAFGQDGIAECCEGVEDIGPAPYKAEIHGYLCDKQYCTVTPGSNTVYLDVYSIKDFSFWDVKTGAPIGIAELFGSLIQVRILVNGQQANDTLGNPLVYTGDGSYARFSHIKAGRYDLEITGSYFSEAHYERNITVGLMEAFEKPTTNYYYYWRALQTRKRYVEVVECTSSDPAMTMHYNGKYYKFVSFLEEFAVTTHATAGVSITYDYGGLTVEYGGKDYAFIASGITDPAGPGGYGDYKSGTSRTVKSLATRENFVNFYYIEIANADMAIKSPSEIKSANPMIILDAGVSYPIGAKYHFKLTSYADSGAATQIATVNSKDNPELFKYSLDEGITWKAYPVGGVANTNTKLLVAARVNVGPRSEVWILPSKELVA